MKQMKILGFTSIRSDYEIMSPLYKLLNNDKDIDFRLIVSGAHLSKSYGFTKSNIEKDRLKVLCEIETLIDSDSARSRLKTASILLQNSIDIVYTFNPDLIIYAGDREDTIMAALIGVYLQIPTIHFYGGDHEMDGHPDTYVRHATAKLSTLHFVAHEEHKKRLESMGESSERIFVVGSISLDRLRNFKEVKKQDIKKIFNISRGFDKFALVIFHPVDTERDKTHIYFSNILISLKKEGINAFVVYPNTDPGNKKILEIISKFKNDPNFIFSEHFERNIFLSIYKHCEFLIGNSSSGIYEAATFKKPVINVGYRQWNRLHTKNVIFCSPMIEDIRKAIKEVYAPTFRDMLSKLENPYGDGYSSQRAYELIRKLDFSSYIPKVEDPLR